MFQYSKPNHIQMKSNFIRLALLLRAMSQNGLAVVHRSAPTPKTIVLKSITARNLPPGHLNEASDGLTGDEGEGGRGGGGWGGGGGVGDGKRTRLNSSHL